MLCLSFACPTNELTDYSEKPVKEKSVQRLQKSKVFWQQMRSIINMLLKP